MRFDITWHSFEALSCFDWLFSNLEPEAKGEGRSKSNGACGLYLMEVRCPLSARLNDRQRIASRKQGIGFWMEMLSRYDSFLEDRNRKVSTRDAFIETSFYTGILAEGPLPPPRWNDIFRLYRSTAEWTQQCQELVALVKEISDVEAAQIEAILRFHTSDSSPVYIASGGEEDYIPQSFLGHPEFLESFKRAIISNKRYSMDDQVTIDEDRMIQELKSMINITNPDTVKKLLRPN